MTTIIELTDDSQLPQSPLMGYILISPEEAAAEHTRKYGAVDTVYRVTRNNGKQTVYIPKGDGHETQQRKATSDAAAPST